MSCKPSRDRVYCGEAHIHPKLPSEGEMASSHERIRSKLRVGGGIEVTASELLVSCKHTPNEYIRFRSYLEWFGTCKSTRHNSRNRRSIVKLARENPKTRHN